MSKNYIKYKKGQDSTKQKDKKIVITILLICVGVILLYYSTMAIMKAIENSEKTVPVNKKISFYPVDENEDITTDAYYMDLDRQIYFEDLNYGTTIAVTDIENSDISSTYKSSFTVLYNYINYAINGDENALNSLFSRKYYADGGEKHEKFTAQKLYNIKITITGTDSITEDGQSYDTFSYYVEYMIYKNNGTFRSDMGSDCTKREYFTVTDRGGKVQIDEYMIYNTTK